MGYELKYAAPLMRASAAEALIQTCYAPETPYATNIVSSLYLDDKDCNMAMGKASSDFLKRKIRIRFYTPLGSTGLHGDPAACYLEVKQKTGPTRRKLRAPLQGVDASWLLDSNKTWQLMSLVQQQLAQWGIVILETLRPALMISYHRKRFVDEFSGNRIALDSKITATRHPWFSDGIREQFALDECVVEVKGDNSRLPRQLYSLTRFQFRPTAFSKYYLGFVGLTGYTQ